MDQFYISMITIGITIIIAVLALILFDKKKSIDYADKLENEKKEVIRVIADSEQMLQELNKFSDYIITQVEEKSVQLSELLNKVDMKILNSKVEKTVVVEAPKETDAWSESQKDSASEDDSRDSIDFINSKHREVMELVEEGMSDVEIAKALKIGKGEVQLIVGMNIHKLSRLK